MSKLKIKDLKELSFEDVIRLINANEIAEPVKITLPLDNALNEKQFDIEGNFIGVIDATDANVAISVKFNKWDSEAIVFTRGLSFIRPFGKLFFTSTAQAGKSISLLISAYAPELFQIIDNRSEAIQTAELTNISNNTGATKNNTRSLNGDTGTQVNKSVDGLALAATTIVHTVTTGKTFYLTSLCLFSDHGGNYGKAILKVRDGSDVDLYELAQVDSIAVQYDRFGIPRSFPTPIKIPAGYDIVVTNTVVVYNTNAQINGWEE